MTDLDDVRKELKMFITAGDAYWKVVRDNNPLNAAMLAQPLQQCYYSAVKLAQHTTPLITELGMLRAVADAARVVADEYPFDGNRCVEKLQEALAALDGEGTDATATIRE